MATYYPLEKEHNLTRFRNWTIYADAADRPNYKIYYIDSEWRTAGNGDGTSTTFSKLQTAFNDGSGWSISAEEEDSNGTFQCIIVRLSDRKAIKCVGTVSGAELANNALWECTDVTDSVWYDDLRKLRLLGNI